MDYRNILIELDELSLKETFDKYDLMEIINDYISIISTYDLMLFTEDMRKDWSHVSAKFRNEYMDFHINNFINMMLKMMHKHDVENKIINKEDFNFCLEVLKKRFNAEVQDIDLNMNKFPLVKLIATIYLTFIIEEPIHPVGTVFPGDFKVEEKDGKYWCPVKDKQMKTEESSCRLCIAKQTPNVEL